MTESSMRSAVANWLVPYVGLTFGDAKHAEILKVYNDSKFCTRYKMQLKDAYCATAASAAFIANGFAGAPGSGKLFETVECNCGYMMNLAIKYGTWVESDSYVPKVGDAVLYDWDDTGVNDNLGWPDHVGIVYSITGNTIKVIEGNMGGGTVGYRDLAVNGRYIRGYIAPKYSKFATPESTYQFKGTVTTALNVRSGAGTENKILRTLKKSTVVEVYNTVKSSNGADWYYIKANGAFGYVNAKYITEAKEPTTPYQFKGTVTTALNVRSGAGTENKILRTIAKGTIVEVYNTVKSSTGVDWYYIKANGAFGYVNAKYISK